MGEITKISWCHHTFNPWRGCTKVSAGCTNCYAETMSKRNPAVLGEWGPEGKRVVGTEAYWRQPFAWDRAAEKAGGRRRVFCASLADVFEDRPELEAQRDRLHALIALTPHLDHLLLTKRPEVARRYYADPDLYQRVLRAAEEFRRSAPGLSRVPISNPAHKQGYWNRWLGVSVEDQKTADERIPLLLETPVAVRFISYEPALGPVSFDRGGWLRPAYSSCQQDDRPEIAAIAKAVAAQGGWVGLDWVIVGGESGPKARPCDVAWIRRVVKQCRETKTACFVKQMGANVRDRNDAGFEADLETYADGPNVGRPTEPRAWPSPLDVEHDPVDTNYQGAPVRIRLRDRAGADPSEWPEDLRVREFPALAARGGA